MVKKISNTPKVDLKAGGLEIVNHRRVIVTTELFSNYGDQFR